jgi:hypothetical protein
MMNDDGFNLMLETASYYKKEILLEQIEEFTKEFNLISTRDNYEKILGVCQLLLAKDMIDTMGMEKVKKMKREHDFSGNLFTQNMN